MEHPSDDDDHGSEESYSKMNDPEPDAGDLESVNIRVAANGGYVVSCQRRAPQTENGPSWIQPKDYVFASKAELDDILDDTLGAGEDAETE